MDWELVFILILWETQSFRSAARLKEIANLNTRRTIFGLLGTWFLKPKVLAEIPPRTSVRELARHALTGSQNGLEAILVEVTAPPKAPAIAHRHPGFVLGYVLDGEMIFAVDGQDQQRVRTGETFFEQIGALHTKGGSAKPDASVKFLAFLVAPKGSPVTLPA